MNGLKEKSLPNYNCIDCGEHRASLNDYMVNDKAWEEAIGSPKGRGLLCLKCLVKRLGRKLTKNDFPLVPINVLRYATILPPTSALYGIKLKVR